MKGPGIPVVNLTEVNNSISNLDTKLNNHWQTIYPVGSIYMSLNSTSPATLFGGTWEQLKDRFLIGCGGTYNNASTGGSINHTHNYGLQAGGYYRDIAIEQNPNAGCLAYDTAGNITVIPATTYESYEAPINNGSENANKTTSMSHFRTIANTSYDSTLPPYLAIYMWKRTA